MKVRRTPGLTELALLCTMMVSCGEGEHSSPYVPQLCSDDLPLVSPLIRKQADGSAHLFRAASKYGCLESCSCAGGTPCGWDAWLPASTLAPGLHRAGVEIELNCYECWGAENTVEGGPVGMGTLEIVAIDAEHVEGCIVGWEEDGCSADVRFSAAWCP